MNRTVLLIIGAGAFAIWAISKYLANESEIADAEGDTEDSMTDDFNSEDGRIGSLLPQVREALLAGIADLEAMGIKIFVGSCLRNTQQQAAIVKGGNSATNKSWHVLGRAADLYPINPDTGKADLAGKRVDLFITMHKVLANYGFTNIGFNADWSKRYITTNKGKVWDGGHVQYTDGLTWSQANAQQNA